MGPSQIRALATAAVAVLAVVGVAWVADRDTDGLNPPPATSTTAASTSTTTPPATTTTEAEVPPLVEAWRFDTEGRHAEGLTTDGTLVFGATRAGRVYALDRAAGALVWTVETGLEVWVAPAAGAGLAVLTGDGSGGGFVVALDAATGQERWRTALPADAGTARPLVLGNSVYVTLADLLAFDAATGQPRWSRFDGIAPTEPVPASDAVTDGGLLFLAVEVWDGRSTYHKEVRALDPATGGDVWAVLAGRAQPQPQVLDGVVAFFVADAAGAAAQLVAVDPLSGQEMWRTRPLDAFGLPAGAGGGIVVQQTTSLVAVDTRTGAPLWEVPTVAYTSPAATPGRVFYVDIELTALDGATGSVVARSQFDAFVDHPPSVAGDLLLLQDAFGTVIAFHIP